VSRAYDSSVREARAQETRLRILESARRLVLDGGYRAMTIASLAAEAGVSPQTVYNSVGGKAEVVKAVYDVMLAGDDEPQPMSERPEFLAVQVAETVQGWAAAYAALSRSIQDRVGPLLSALLEHGPGGDPVLEELVTSINRERRRGNESSLRGLTSLGLVPKRAAERKHIVDVVWLVTGPEVYDHLVGRAGWSGRSYEAWLAAQLEAAVSGMGIRKGARD
jgi:AcrR family transcriptional regulator